MDSSPKSRNGKQDKKLRIITILTMVPALCLLIPAGVVPGKALPALGLLSMLFSCVVSMTALGSKKEHSYVRFASPGADFIAATLLMVLMVLSWVFIAGDWDLQAANAMLAAYGLVTLMVNFCIHTYLALRSLSMLFQPSPCPNCNHITPSILPRWSTRHVALPADDSAPAAYQPASQTQGPAQDHSGGPGHSRSSKEIYAPFMHSYGDADARELSEFQTSGFNTPRQSAETLRSEGRESRKGLVDRKDGSLV